MNVQTQVQEWIATMTPVEKGIGGVVLAVLVLDCAAVFGLGAYWLVRSPEPDVGQIPVKVEQKPVAVKLDPPKAVPVAAVKAGKKDTNVAAVGTVFTMGGLLCVGFSMLAWLVSFAPAIVALARGHQNTAAIFVLCLFLGWTGIFWIFALVWACTEVRKQAAT